MKYFFIGFFLFAFIGTMYGQKKSLNNKQAEGADYDSTYYQTFERELLVRFYFSQKYSLFDLPKVESVEKLSYLPNTTLNMGVGATYQSFTLNLAYGFGFLNQDQEKGKTKYLDLQAHMYGRKQVIDFFGQFYRGYYLREPKGTDFLPAAYYVRPDMRVAYGGLSYGYVFNHRRFSYRAVMIMNEWQKKSAGTFFINGEAYYGRVKADSSFVPWAYKPGHPQSMINQVQFFQIGPGVGYAYAWVIKKHFFMMGSLQTNLNLSYTKEFDQMGDEGRFSVRPNLSYKLSLGYNGSVWNTNINWVSNAVNFKGASSTRPYQLETGNIRLNISRRIAPGPKLEKQLKRIPIFH